MKNLIIKGLIVFATLYQAAFAQNTYQSKERGTMGKDSTDLVPSGMTAVPTNQTFTSSYVSISGQCGSDNGKTLSAAPTNLCSAGTASTVYTNGSSFAWSCTGNYGTASTVSCGATQAAPQAIGAVCFTAGSHSIPNSGMSYIIYKKADGSTSKDYGFTHPMSNQPGCFCGACGWLPLPNDGWWQLFNSLVTPSEN